MPGGKDPLDGLINPDDYEKGLEEAWERAKPAGSTVTVKDKLKQLSKQNNPHWESWRAMSARRSDPELLPPPK